MNYNDKDALYDTIAKAVVEELLTYKVKALLEEYVPVSISARHIHLEQTDADVLFGKGYKFTKFKNISQPGQYSCQETVTIQGSKSSIAKVRVVAPIRKQTQVEVSRTDARKLGVAPPVRHSGDLQGSASLTVIGPNGSLNITEGCIVADRHIHMSPKDAADFAVTNLQKVAVEVDGIRGGRMNNVTIRVSESYALDMHIDTDDANAFGLTGKEHLKLIALS